jgi:HD-like signal output (HDOD) protein
LLHDIGKLLLDQSVLNNYSRITDYVEKRGVQIWQAEERMIGIDHARLGGLIAEHWNFPVDLAEAIRFHHAPPFSKVNQRLAAIVNLANSFSEDYQQTKSALLSFHLHPETLRILRLVPKEIQDLKSKIKASGMFPGD